MIDEPSVIAINMLLTLVPSVIATKYNPSGVIRVIAIIRIVIANIVLSVSLVDVNSLCVK